MSDTTISVENLSKSYLVGHNATQSERYTALRDVIARNARNLARKTRDMLSGRAIVQGDEIEEFWALRDVSFEIKQGDRVGIIGRNGAGKSTLLKILSRITEPTTGRIKIAGRVASLLEVGTGFHPELTGRENVFLNGAILGMSRREIQRKFDEIVEFAEVEKFLDTPVKRYSSGMYVRLAFAVAAHLEPEILIVDEVLAVGDAQFQKKCLGKMDHASKSGKTVIFVSHNMLAIQKLCNRCLMLEGGKLEFNGSVEIAVNKYFATEDEKEYKGTASETKPRITSVRLESHPILTNEDVTLRIEWHVPNNISGLKVGIGINTNEGLRVFDSCPEDVGMKTNFSRGFHGAVITIPKNSLLAKTYLVSAGLWNHTGSLHHILPALQLNVEATPNGPYSHQQTRDGLVNVKCEWNLL